MIQVKKIGDRATFVKTGDASFFEQLRPLFTGVINGKAYVPDGEQALEYFRDKKVHIEVTEYELTENPGETHA